MRSCRRSSAETRALFAALPVMLLAPLSLANAMQPALQAVLDCQRVANDQARLTCYDRAATSLGQRALAAPQWKSGGDARPDFDPAKPFHQPPPKSETPDLITVPLVGIGESDGKTVFYLGSNQVWRAQNDDFIYVDPAKRNTVTIKRSLLGLGYLLMINSSDREISVRRVK